MPVAYSHADVLNVQNIHNHSFVVLGPQSSSKMAVCSKNNSRARIILYAAIGVMYKSATSGNKKKAKKTILATGNFQGSETPQRILQLVPKFEGFRSGISLPVRTNVERTVRPPA